MHVRPNHPSDGPAYILPSPLPSPPRLEKRAQTPPPASSRKRSAPDDEITEVEPLAKRVKTDKNGAATLPVIASPSKRRKLEEDGLLILSSKDDKIDDDVIEID